MPSTWLPSLREPHHILTAMSPRKPRPPKVRPPAPDAIDAPWRLFLAILLIGYFYAWKRKVLTWV